MSESMFLRRNTNTFLAAHPREEGWMVYEFTSDAARKMYLHYLLDCLRDWHSDALKRRTALSFVEEDELRKSFKKSQASSAGTTKDAVNEMDSFGWRGSIELEWEGQDIHCRMFSLVMSNGCADVYLVATKSHAVFQDFLLVLDR